MRRTPRSLGASMRPTTSRVGIGVLGALALGCSAREEAPAGIGDEARASTEELQRTGEAPVVVAPTLDRELVARAQPDECYDGIGFPAGAPPCGEGTVPKTNEAYLGAAARSGDHAYFGTIANMPCMVS